MKKADANSIHEELERIRGECTWAPGPKGDDFPDWTHEGVESTNEFFDGAAHIWDARFADTYRFLHVVTADVISATDAPIEILDVGCGTGLELEYIFNRAPNAQITGMDQAPRMLEQLRTKYSACEDQISLVQTSFLEWPQGLSNFDFAVSILTLHHFPPQVKLGIYRSIVSALGESGVYIEGDQMVPPDVEAKNLDLYERWIAKLPDGHLGAWNYDIRLSVDANRRLLLEAGFADCAIRFDQSETGPDGHAVLECRL